eukprot:COSAG02_NODE_27937_length_599_cov_454.600000_1_plen_94_part_01
MITSFTIQTVLIIGGHNPIPPADLSSALGRGRAAAAAGRDCGDGRRHPRIAPMDSPADRVHEEDEEVLGAPLLHDLIDAAWSQESEEGWGSVIS